jgi:hypothetical protein
MPPQLTQDQKVMIIDYWRQGFNRWEAERTIARRPGTGYHFATTDDEEANIYSEPAISHMKLQNKLGTHSVFSAV